MALPDSLVRKLGNLGFGGIRDSHPVSGGSINEAWRLTLADGQALFGKVHGDPPRGFFEAEAQGLQALAATGTIRVPEVIAVAPGYLVLEWLDGSPADDYWACFGQQLADLHRHTRAQFGFCGDNFCGLTPQPNPATDNGYEFFAEARLMHQGRLARDSQLLDAEDIHRLELVARRLPEWLPVQPASLIHGDLWQGNAHCGPAGEPVLVDPAAHYGWHEAELAMTRLFGAFPKRFYQAYEAHSGCDPNWRERADLYNLYHLLNHLILFGGGYLGSVRAILKQFGDASER
ncbi:MAG: fructosamine kinase family protein [Marinobacter sp.]|uniref:fructosamine kinase family protein n=1 Tax=Marinobacter sp. TaxID=50741 RepID=UPI00299F0C6F|nr:fructosamine kinase family protein [Marinobacter sp.]MDX1635581.1 fructosamine kinase family protein [Marinobacter sp.]